MLELYYFPSPNGLKVAIMLEESGLEYRLRPVDILRGEQFAADYLRINPNNKIPSLVDTETGISLFESGAILQYLAERSGRYLPAAPAARAQALSWLFWQVGGLGPMAGQAHHFRAFASERIPYAIQRYTDEVNRLYGVLNRRLASADYLAAEYSIADMACWPWIRPHERQGQDLAAFPALADWFARIAGRPAVQRALALGDERMADAEGHRHLYGQTAASVIAASKQREEDS